MFDRLQAVEDRYERLAQYAYDNIGDPKGIADNTVHDMLEKL